MQLRIYHYYSVNIGAVILCFEVIDTQDLLTYLATFHTPNAISKEPIYIQYLGSSNDDYNPNRLPVIRYMHRKDSGLTATGS
jgi:hypothetical protein